MTSPDLPAAAANDDAFTDTQRRFLFEHADIRGELVCLEKTYRDATDHHQLPQPIQHLLGECFAAVSLLASTLKFEGTITLQAKGTGPLTMIMAESNDEGHLRGIARPAEGVSADAFNEGNFQSWLGQGAVLAIIIEPKTGQRYQGIVPLDAPNLNECLQHYFEQSEQLNTRFWLFSDDDRCGGLLLQALPQSANRPLEEAQDQWDTLSHLGATVKPEEILYLSSETLLYRLYHEWSVRVFDPKPLIFRCSCSRERCITALQATGADTVKDIIQEQGKVQMDCQFCLTHYEFDLDDLGDIFPNVSSQHH